jgi:hypothetical protein
MHYNVFQYLKVNMWGDLGLMENGMHAIFSLVFQVLQTTDVVPEDSCVFCVAKQRKLDVCLELGIWLNMYFEISASFHPANFYSATSQKLKIMHCSMFCYYI